MTSNAPIEDNRPLPEGWVKEWSEEYGRYYYIDTEHGERSIWTHPLSDPIYQASVGHVQHHYAPPPGTPEQASRQMSPQPTSRQISPTPTSQTSPSGQYNHHHWFSSSGDRNEDYERERERRRGMEMEREREREREYDMQRDREMQYGNNRGYGGPQGYGPPMGYGQPQYYQQAPQQQSSGGFLGNMGPGTALMGGLLLGDILGD